MSTYTDFATVVLKMFFNTSNKAPDHQMATMELFVSQLDNWCRSGCNIDFKKDFKRAQASLKSGWPPQILSRNAKQFKVSSEHIRTFHSQESYSGMQMLSVLKALSAVKMFVFSGFPCLLLAHVFPARKFQLQVMKTEKVVRTSQSLCFYQSI